MTHRLALVLGLAAGCYGSTPPVVSNRAAVQPTASRPVVRRYCQAHEVPVVCDQPPPGEDMCPQQAEDTLELHEVSASSLAVTIELVRTNGHTCSFEGTLSRAAPAEQRWIFTDPNIDAPCTLELVERGNEIEINATGCRDYCGTRATLDGQFDTAATCAAPRGTESPCTEC